MKSYLWLLLILVVPMLGGCGVTGPIDINGLADAATDRIGAEVQIRAVDAQTKQEIAKIYQEKEKTKQAKANAQAQVVLTINDPQSMALYQLGQANERLAQSNEMMGETMQAMASGKGRFWYLANTPEYRKGAFAEGMDSFFGGIADVGNSAGGKLLSGGYATKMIGSEFRKAQGSTTFNGDATISDSYNSSTLHQTGNTSSTATLTPSVEIVDPAVVDPVIVETGGE